MSPLLFPLILPFLFFLFFFFNATSTPELYTLSLHDALPISPGAGAAVGSVGSVGSPGCPGGTGCPGAGAGQPGEDRKSTRLNSSHVSISYAVFCLKKKKKKKKKIKYKKSNIKTK